MNMQEICTQTAVILRCWKSHSFEGERSVRLRCECAVMHFQFSSNNSEHLLVRQMTLQKRICWFVVKSACLNFSNLNCNVWRFCFRAVMNMQWVLINHLQGRFPTWRYLWSTPPGKYFVSQFVGLGSGNCSRYSSHLDNVGYLKRQWTRGMRAEQTRYMPWFLVIWPISATTYQTTKCAGLMF